MQLREMKMQYTAPQSRSSNRGGGELVHSNDISGGGRIAMDSSTCTAAAMPVESKGVRLFGVKLTHCQNFSSRSDQSTMGMMRKSVSMGNLGLMGLKAMPMHSDSAARAHAETLLLQPCLEPRLGSIRPAHGETQRSGYVSDGLMQSSSMSARERRKGVPWTEEEHRLFLAGLLKLGKGDWRGISRNFVMSRTPTQVASHAQKYFLRQSNLNKRKRRSSLFDIINSNNTVPAIEEHPQSFAAAELSKPVWELGMQHGGAPCSSLINPLLKSRMPAFPNVSADLCLGHSSCLHGQEPRVVADQDLPLHGTRGKQASAILLSNEAVGMEEMATRTNQFNKPVITVSSSSSSRSSSSSSSSLCRIDEASEHNSSLSLSIAPPMPTNLSSELALKPEPPMADRQSAIFSPTSNVCEHKDVVLLTAGA